MVNLLQHLLFNDNQTATQAGWGSLVYTCEINDNSTGVEIGPVGFGQVMSAIENNHLSYNTDYKIDNRTYLNLFIPANCACTGDSAEMEERILDGFVDITKGLISYIVFNTSSIILSEPVYNLPNTSILESSAKSEINIFPNPFSDLLNISNNGNFSLLEMLDMCGRMYTSSKLKEGKNQIIVESLQAGVYFFRLANIGSNTQYVRMIKQEYLPSNFSHF